MRISDWSSDVCSSDLAPSSMNNTLRLSRSAFFVGSPTLSRSANFVGERTKAFKTSGASPALACAARDRKSVAAGKSVSVRVALGGRRITKKNKHTRHHSQTRQTTYATKQRASN